jgi:hypothetical protein
VDRRAVALTAATAALLLAGAMKAPAPALNAMRWLAPDADAVFELTTRPTECLAMPSTPEARSAVEIGRAAFRSPFLLGGQAARAGLSCESCHRSGRGNPVFLFPGISGAPGTADVTASLFSRHRGDGIDNPKPIPDLSGPVEGRTISREPASPELERFLRGLVVEEFDGAEPPPAVLAGLVAYVRALEPGACPAGSREPLRAGAMAADAARAVAAAEGALAAGDRATALAMLLAARGQLGELHERYAGPGLEVERLLLREADADLAAIAQAIREGDASAGPRLAAWRLGSAGLGRRLEETERRSLLSPAVVAGRR